MSKKRSNEDLRKEQEMARKEETLRKLGFQTERIEYFLDEPFVIRIIREEYSNFKESVTELKSGAPEEITEKIEELAERYTNLSKEYEKDARINFKYAFLSYMIDISDLLDLKSLPEEVTEKFFGKLLVSRNSQEVAGFMLRELCCEISKMLFNEFVEDSIKVSSTLVFERILHSCDSLFDDEDSEE